MTGRYSLCMAGLPHPKFGDWPYKGNSAATCGISPHQLRLRAGQGGEGTVFFLFPMKSGSSVDWTRGSAFSINQQDAIKPCKRGASPSPLLQT